MAEREAGINPRTHLPYQRGDGQGYGREKSESAAAEIKKRLAAAAKADDTATTTTEVTSLKSQVSSLEAQVKLLQDGQELAVKNAELMAQQGVSEQLLSRYMQGLRDGASLSAGHGMSPPVHQPGSGL